MASLTFSFIEWTEIVFGVSIALVSTFLAGDTEVSSSPWLVLESLNDESSSSSLVSSYLANLIFLAVIAYLI